jgi:hypothetical protein
LNLDLWCGIKYNWSDQVFVFFQDLKLSPEPVGRTLAWRCFSAAGSTTERAVDDDVPATTANGAGAVAAGGVTGNAGGLADPSDDSRRLIFAEFRRAMLNIAQALGTPVYLGGRWMFCSACRGYFAQMLPAFKTCL